MYITQPDKHCPLLYDSLHGRYSLNLVHIRCHILDYSGICTGDYSQYHHYLIYQRTS